MKEIFVRDIMSKKVVSVKSEMPLLEVAKIISDKGFNGVPVIDGDKRLLGLVTEYSLISKGSMLHLPTLQAVLGNLPVLKKDKSDFQEKVKDVIALRAKDVMDAEPITLSPETTFANAVSMFQLHHRINPIPIIDKNRTVVGVLSRHDVLKAFSLIKKHA